MYARGKIRCIILLRGLEEPLRRVGIVFEAVQIYLCFLQIKLCITGVKIERLINQIKSLSGLFQINHLLTLLWDL